VPTREQALKDVEMLHQSKAWQAIRWQDKESFSYPLGEEWTWGYIENQVKPISDQELAKTHSIPATAVTLR
jgi:hypothetical protein